MALPTKGADWSSEAGPTIQDAAHVLDANGNVLLWIDRNGVLNSNNNPSSPVVLGTFGGVPTVSHGMAIAVCHQDYAAQSAAISNLLYYTVPANRAGFFRVTWSAKVTVPASVSSVLGGGSAFQLTYTDGVDNTVLTSPSTAFSGNGGNVATTQGSGVVNIYAAANSAININFGYTSSGTPMQYYLHVRLEDM